MTTKKLFSLGLLLAVAVSFVSCGERQSVTIDGVRWATRNVDTPGTFVRSSLDAGGLFTWYEAQNACPQGWRLPTREEAQSLSNASGEAIALNGVPGRAVGSASNELFLPFAGFRRINGTLAYEGFEGLYWSSTEQGANAAWFLFSNINNSNNVQIQWNRNAGLSVRCVAE